MITQPWVSQLLTLLNPKGVQPLAGHLAHTLMVTVSPTLLLIGLYVRLLEVQGAAIVGVGRFGLALRDAFVWSFVLVAYFEIGQLINDYVNALYADLAQIGSLRAISIQMNYLLSVSQGHSVSVVEQLESIGSLPMRMATIFTFYVTLIVAIFLDALLRIAQSIGYEVAFLYGLIAIPLSLSVTISLLRGWAKLMGFFLLWPVVQALLLAVFSPIFTNALVSLRQTVGHTGWTAVYAHLLFTVLNLIVCAVLLVAPLLTHALIDNAGGAQPLLAPYLGAIQGFGASMSRGVDAVAGRAGSALLAPDPEPMSAVRARMPELHIAPDPEFVPSPMVNPTVLTNYLDPRFDDPSQDSSERGRTSS